MNSKEKDQISSLQTQVAVVVKDTNWIKKSIKRMNKKLDHHIDWGEKENDKIYGRLRSLENWKYYILGISVALIFVINYLIQNGHRLLGG